MAEFEEPGEELDFGPGQEAHYKEHKKELLGKLRLEAESLKNNRDHIVGELAKLDYNHQREALHDLNDHYPSLSEFHLSSKSSRSSITTTSARRCTTSTTTTRASASST